MILAVVVNIAVASPANGNHPGENIDEYMNREEKTVVLNFVFASCTDVWPMHSAVIADVQDKINITPMKDSVQFISVTTDPANDKADVLQDYAGIHGLDPVNWLFLTIPPGAAVDTTRKLADAYNVQFAPMDDGQQIHSVVTHVINRDG